MVTAADLLDNLEQLNLMNIAKQALGRTNKEFIESQKKQMMQGKGKDGTKRPNYSKRSQVEFGKADIPITLRDTGSFQDSIFLDVGSDEFEIDSTDSKSEMLKKKYDRYGGVFGLEESNKDNYIENSFAPEFQAIITEKTGLQFK